MNQQGNSSGQGRGMGRGQGGRGGGRGVGPGGVCVCPNCGHETQHPRGTPCFEMKCPKCGAQMARK